VQPLATSLLWQLVVFVVVVIVAAVAAAAVVDGVRTKSSQSMSCQCNRLATEQLRVWTEEVLQW